MVVINTTTKLRPESWWCDHQDLMKLCDVLEELAEIWEELEDADLRLEFVSVRVEDAKSWSSDGAFLSRDYDVVVSSEVYTDAQLRDALASLLLPGE